MHNEFASFISLLLASRDQAHIFHLRTNSYAEHKALNEYYDGVLDLIDGLVEGFQGKYGILGGYEHAKAFIETGDALAYFEQLATLVESTRHGIPQDSYLQNDVDEVVALIYVTIYKLKYLK